jgi:lysosomal acid lipase/cholesteryl ester hydrolase
MLITGRVLSEFFGKIVSVEFQLSSRSEYSREIDLAMKVKLFILFTALKFVFGEATDDVLVLIENAGYKGEVHEVKTEDGYFLQVHRVLPMSENHKKNPVFLMHGLFAASADFVVTGPKLALAYLLADNGYDVWMGNARGNKHSTLHKKFPPNSKEYWNFSWHEIGFYDLPAMIDLALKETKASKAFYVGHSQGTTSLLVMLSTRPEYNDKIIQAHLVSPAAFIANSPHPIGRTLGEQVMNGMLNNYTYFEFGKLWNLAEEFSKTFCVEGQRTTLALCEGIIFGIVGANKNGVEIDEVNSNLELLLECRDNLQYQFTRL